MSLKYQRSLSLMLLFSGCFFLLSPYSSFAQKVCRPSGGKRSTRPASQSVTIQITDETNGRIVTYEKEFKLDHIPPGLRDAYITHLEDSLLYSGKDDLRLTNSKTNTPRKAAPQRNAPPQNARLARVR